ASRRERSRKRQRKDTKSENDSDSYARYVPKNAQRALRRVRFALSILAVAGRDCRTDKLPSVHPTLPSFRWIARSRPARGRACIGRAGNTPELIVHAISLSVANGSWRR